MFNKRQYNYNNVFLNGIDMCVSGGYLGPPPGDPHVQGVVAAGLGVGHAAAALVGLQQGLVPLREDVSDHHGGPASQRRLGDTHAFI